MGSRVFAPEALTARAQRSFRPRDAPHSTTAAGDARPVALAGSPGPRKRWPTGGARPLPGTHCRSSRACGRRGHNCAPGPSTQWAA